MAGMRYGLSIPFLQLLLLFAAIGQLLCVESSLVKEPTIKNPRGGITASLIRRDQYFKDESDAFTSREEMVQRDARRSKLRVQSLMSKRQLAGGTPNPAPGSADWETNLTDASPAEYLMAISLGTPAQNFIAIADTGSDLTWLQCAPCSNCEQGNTFQPSKSSTYSPLPCSSTVCVFLNESGSICPSSSAAPPNGCDYGYEYGDGSETTGTLAQDTITLQTTSGASQTVTGYSFGCSNNAASNSSLLSKTDGLVGLGRGNISFPSQLGKYFGNKFGYCLVNRTNTNVVESSPLFFGADAVPTNVAQLQYTPILTGAISTFYYVNCTGISLAGQSIAAIPATAFDIVGDNGGIFFDSGTTYTSLADSIFDSLSDAIKKAITDHTHDPFQNPYFPLCYVITSWNDWVADYGQGVPVISFQFSNTSGFSLPAESAWVQIDKVTACLAIQKSGNISIFGSYQQVGYHLVYDLENVQLGFVQADCKPTVVTTSNSHRRIASGGTTVLSGLLSLLLLLLFAQ